MSTEVEVTWRDTERRFEHIAAGVLNLLGLYLANQKKKDGFSMLRRRTIESSHQVATNSVSFETFEATSRRFHETA